MAAKIEKKFLMNLDKKVKFYQNNFEEINTLYAEIDSYYRNLKQDLNHPVRLKLWGEENLRKLLGELESQKKEIESFS